MPKNRTLVLLLSLMIVVLAAACGSSSDSESDSGGVAKITPSGTIYSLDDLLAVGFKPRQGPRPGAGGDDDVLGGKRLFVSIIPGHVDFSGAVELRLAVDDGDFVFLQQEPDAFVELVRDSTRALDHLL